MTPLLASARVRTLRLASRARADRRSRPERARAALERLGERTWTEALDWLYDRAMQRPTAPDLYPALRAAYYGPSGKPPGSAATGCDVGGRARRVPRATGAVPVRRATPRIVQLLHAAADPDRDRRRDARRVDQPRHRPVARRHGCAVRRGRGHPLAVRPHRLRRRRVGHPRVGRRHGERHGVDSSRATSTWRSSAASRRPRAAHNSKTRASTSRTKRISRSRAASTCWASRSRRCGSCRRTTGTACAPSTWPPRSPRTERPG